jgi:SNF2 family DNA or RNA helicase
MELLEQARRVRTATKADAVVEIIREFDGCFVVFVEFVATVETLSRRLRKEGLNVIEFTGSLSAREKGRRLKKARTGDAVLIASRVGSEGLNMQWANMVINHDLPWNPMVLEQRIGRVHRLGQKEDVTVFNLSVNGTIEARILELLARKIKMFEAIVGEMELGNIAEKVTRFQSGENQQRTTITVPIYYSGSDPHQGMNQPRKPHLIPEKIFSYKE